MEPDLIEAALAAATSGVPIEPPPPSSECWELPVCVARVDVSSVSEIFNPDYKDKQLKLCDHVNLWSQNLSQTLAELMAWKDDVFELSVLPLNMLSQLVIISSRLARGKGEMLPPLHEAMSLTRSFITGKVVNQEVEVLKATLIRQSNELELETMRRVEAERKLKLATAQVIKLRADAKIFRWARMTARLEVRRLKLHHTREAESLRQHNELLQQMVLNLRKKLGMTGDDTGVAFGSTTRTSAEQLFTALDTADEARNLRFTGVGAEASRVSATHMREQARALLHEDDHVAGHEAVGTRGRGEPRFEEEQGSTIVGNVALSWGAEPSGAVTARTAADDDRAVAAAEEAAAVASGSMTERAWASSGASGASTHARTQAAEDLERELQQAGLPLFPLKSEALDENKETYTKQETVQARLMHSKQLDFVSELYSKRIQRLEQRLQGVLGSGGMHVRLRKSTVAKASQPYYGAARAKAREGMTAGVGVLEGVEQVADATARVRAGVEASRGEAQAARAASPRGTGGPEDARFLPAVCMPQPVPPRLARKLRRQGYTPRPAYVKAKAALGGMV